MKTIILYARRNVGMAALSFLVAKGFGVKVITDDSTVHWLAKKLNCELVDLNTMGYFDFFICCHGNKYIDEKYLVEGKFINIHPNLAKYKGHNPIKQHIANEDYEGTVDSHYMTKTIDDGDLIYSDRFLTGKCESYADFYNIALPYYFRVLEKTLEILNK